MSAYRKLSSEKRQTNGYRMFLMGFAGSTFPDFECYLRIVVQLDEDDIWLISNKKIQNFVTYGKTTGIQSNKYISEVVFTLGDYEGTLQVEYADISMKTKFNLTRFGGTFETLRFIEKSFFNTLFRF